MAKNEEQRAWLRRVWWVASAAAEVHHRKESKASVDGVEHAPLVPLHVSDAPHRLDLWDLGAKLIVVLELALFKQVLIASVSRVLIAHPAESRLNEMGDK